MYYWISWGGDRVTTKTLDVVLTFLYVQHYENHYYSSSIKMKIYLIVYNITSIKLLDYNDYTVYAYSIFIQ